MTVKRTPLADRLWSRVDKSGTPHAAIGTPCWVWIGNTNSKGYGGIGTGERQRSMFTHRAAWLVANGPIPIGLFVLHRCDNPPCCNPAHLFLGTRGDNNADMKAKGRRLGRCAGADNRAHRLTVDQVDEIRRTAMPGSYSAIGRAMGVCADTIRRAALGQSWKGSVEP